MSEQRNWFHAIRGNRPRTRTAGGPSPPTLMRRSPKIQHVDSKGVFVVPVCRPPRRTAKNQAGQNVRPPHSSRTRTAQPSLGSPTCARTRFGGIRSRARPMHASAGHRGGRHDNRLTPRAARPIARSCATRSDTWELRRSARCGEAGVVRTARTAFDPEPGSGLYSQTPPAGTGRTFSVYIPEFPAAA